MARRCQQAGKVAGLDRRRGHTCRCGSVCFLPPKDSTPPPHRWQTNLCTFLCIFPGILDARPPVPLIYRDYLLSGSDKRHRDRGRDGDGGGGGGGDGGVGDRGSSDRRKRRKHETLQMPMSRGDEPDESEEGHRYSIPSIKWLVFIKSFFIFSKKL